MLFGPDMNNFEKVSDLLLRSGDAVRVHDAECLYSNVAMLLRDRNRSQSMGKSAFEVFYANKGETEKTIGELRGML